MSDGPGDHEGRTEREPAASFTEISKFIQTAAEQMREFGLTSIDVEHQGSRVRLRSTAHREQRSGAAPAPVQRTAAVEEPIVPEDESVFITAPMIGTYYAAPGPGEPVFIEPGDEIDVGQTIAIIEAMKIMNEIAADRAGVVLEILVRNAQAVEFGQPLLRLAPIDGT